MVSHRQRSALLSFVGVAVVLAWPGQSLAQNTSADVPPVIDIHVHAMDESFPGIGPMCPNTSAFTASDPSTKEASFGWVREECTGLAIAVDGLPGEGFWRRNRHRTPPRVLTKATAGV